MCLICLMKSKILTVSKLDLGKYCNTIVYLIYFEDTKCNQSKHRFYQNNKKVKPVYKGHSTEPENLSIMSSCPLYTG